MPQQIHLDVMVESVDDATPRVLALGATRLAGDDVFADPAGHRNDNTAADRAAVRAVVNALESAVECREPISQFGGHRIIDAFLGQRLRHIRRVAGLALGLSIPRLSRTDIGEQREHTRPLRIKQRPSPLQFHPSSPSSEQVTASW